MQWKASNLLSLSRILLLVPISLLLLHDDPSQLWIILVLIVVAAATDFLDGMVARRFNQVTELGKILDPVADKICIGVVCLILLLQEKVPLWFFIIVIARDLFILLGGLFVRKRKGLLLQSNTIGKWTAACLTVYLLFALINLESLGIINVVLLIMSTILLIGSFTLYLLRFFSVIRLKN